jgi:hypothetical protein
MSTNTESDTADAQPATTPDVESEPEIDPESEPEVETEAEPESDPSVDTDTDRDGDGAAENDTEREMEIEPESEGGDDDAEVVTSPPQQFTAAIKGGAIKEFVSTLRAIVDEAKIRVGPDGIHTRAVDPANVAMYDISLAAGAFESYDATEGVLGVKLERFEEVLKLPKTKWKTEPYRGERSIGGNFVYSGENLLDKHLFVHRVAPGGFDWGPDASDEKACQLAIALLALYKGVDYAVEHHHLSAENFVRRELTEDTWEIKRSDFRCPDYVRAINGRDYPANTAPSPEAMPALEDVDDDTERSKREVEAEAVDTSSGGTAGSTPAGRRSTSLRGSRTIPRLFATVSTGSVPQQNSSST